MVRGLPRLKDRVAIITGGGKVLASRSLSPSPAKAPSSS